MLLLFHWTMFCPVCTLVVPYLSTFVDWQNNAQKNYRKRKKEKKTQKRYFFQVIACQVQFAHFCMSQYLRCINSRLLLLRKRKFFGLHHTYCECAAQQNKSNSSRFSMKRFYFFIFCTSLPLSHLPLPKWCHCHHQQSNK